MNFLFLCLIGIFSNIIGITFNLPFINLLASILLMVGLSKLTLNPESTKKVKRYCIISIPFLLLCIFMYIRNVNNAELINNLILGICVFFGIYISFYFTEAIITYATTANQLAATRSLRGVWALNGILIFLYFIAYSSLIPLVINIGRVLIMISGIYYCFTIKKAGNYLLK